MARSDTNNPRVTHQYESSNEAWALALRSWRTAVIAKNGENAGTWAVYRSSVEMLQGYLDAFGIQDRPEDVTPDLLLEFFAWLRRRISQRGRPMAVSTVLRYHRALSVFFRHLESRDFVAVSPMRKVPSPRMPVRYRDVFTVKEAQALLATCKIQKGERGKEAEWLKLRDAAMFLTLLDTGLRADELVRLRKSELMWTDDGRLRYRITGKGNRERLVEWGLKAQEAMVQWLRVRPAIAADALWVSKFRKPMKYDALRYAVTSRAALAGVKKERLGPHTFRHTFGTWTRESLDGEAVQTLMGHSTAAMTELYTGSRRQERALQAKRGASPGDMV